MFGIEQFHHIVHTFEDLGSIFKLLELKDLPIPIRLNLLEFLFNFRFVLCLVDDFVDLVFESIQLDFKASGKLNARE